MKAASILVVALLAITLPPAVASINSGKAATALPLPLSFDVGGPSQQRDQPRQATEPSIRAGLRNG